VSITSVDNALTTTRSHLNFVLASCENLPFKNNTFDVGLACRSLHFVGNIATGLQEIDRILRPGATFIIINYPNFNFQDKKAEEIYSGFCQIVFRQELNEYWSANTSRQFSQYFDPENRNRRKLYSRDETSIVVYDEKINLLDLEDVVKRSAIVKSYIEKVGQDVFLEHFRKLQYDLLRLRNIDPEDLLFDECHFGIKFQISFMVSTKNEATNTSANDVNLVVPRSA